MKKSDYTRSTMECKFEEFNPKFLQYLKTYIEVHKLQENDLNALACFETKNLKRGFLGKLKTSYTEICITKRFLFWAIIDEKKESGVAAAQWNEISEIKEWHDTDAGNYVEDFGVELFGFIYQWSKRSRWFIGIENNDAGSKCRELMIELIHPNR